jgi:hypothetical protein
MADPESLLTSPAFVEILRSLGLTNVDADAFQMLVCIINNFIFIILFFQHHLFIIIIVLLCVSACVWVVY